MKEIVKKYGWLCLLTIVMSAALAFCVLIQPYVTFASDALSFLVFSDSGEAEAIKCWDGEGDRCYVFLPSYADLSRTEIRLERSGQYRLDGEELSSGLNCGRFELDTDYELTGLGFSSKTLQFVRSANVATMYIHTSSGSMDLIHKDKDRREDAAICLYAAEGTIDYEGDCADQIRGHGNTTWEEDKKSYNLYIQQKSSLLNMRAGFNWILLANAKDDTNLRNKMVLDLARQVGGYEGFAPGCEFVDLYLNGEYAGLYLLCEKIEVAEDRLKLGANSYLFAFEYVGRAKESISFLLNPGAAVEIKYPTACTEQEKEVLKSRLLDYQASLLAADGKSPDTGKSWLAYIDLDSWARKYLIEEIFENYDAGAWSHYYYWNHDDGKLYAGPCWDYDNTLGLQLHKNPRIFLAQRDHTSSRTYIPWFHELWKKAEFRDCTMEIYKSDILPWLTVLDKTIDEESRTIESASKCNALRWNQASADASVKKIKEFLNERIDFLNSAWVEGVQYRTITFKISGGYCYYCVVDGTICEDLPTPEDLDIEGDAIWVREDTREPFDVHSLITEDLALKAKTMHSDRLSAKSLLAVSMAASFLLFLLLLFFIDYRRNRQKGRYGHG